MSTHTLRVLTVHFDTPIEPWELPAFRRAVARKGGWEHQHFHNNNETGGLHYRLSQNLNVVCCHT